MLFLVGELLGRCLGPFLFGDLLRRILFVCLFLKGFFRGGHQLALLLLALIGLGFLDLLILRKGSIFRLLLLDCLLVKWLGEDLLFLCWDLFCFRLFRGDLI